MTSDRAFRLKTLLAGKRAALMPGVPNALFARLVENHGFECAYITGAGIANMHLGVPDIGLVTLSEVVDHVWATCDATNLPVLVDCDTGFGNSINTRRTIRMVERAGAAGAQIEDQVFPKRCGHFSGKAVIPVNEMVQKIRAAVDARSDDNFQVVARTDAIAVHGVDAAIDRAHAFIEAGADVTFVEAPGDRATIARIAMELPVPQIINLVHGGQTPPVPQAELIAMGFGATLYANAVLQGALLAVDELLSSLKERGSIDAVRERLATFEMRQSTVGKDEYDRLEERYSV